VPCDACGGARLNPIARAVTVGGPGIHEVADDVAGESHEFFDDPRAHRAGGHHRRAGAEGDPGPDPFLLDVGLDYLTLSRSAATLAGGEAQRIRLATQIGSGLVGVLYILDEPSIGLHQRDNQRLIETLIRLRDLGNTLIVVEHDEDTIRVADHIVDIGPGRASTAATSSPRVPSRTSAPSPTRSPATTWPGGGRSPCPETRRRATARRSPSGGHRAQPGRDRRQPSRSGRSRVTGVSGSGKSTLVEDILSKALAPRSTGPAPVPGGTRRSGIEAIDKVIDIDQSPIGRTPRSNPATYTKVFDHIRALFAATPEARARGYKPGRFSFNVSGGRCEACKGDGTIKIEMHFLPDVYVPCEVCGGKRYNRETLEITVEGPHHRRRAGDVGGGGPRVLREPAQDRPHPPDPLRRRPHLHPARPARHHPVGRRGPADQAGLGAGEALHRQTFYILDEPTTGLHFEDIRKLLQVLQRLVDSGNTVVVIEHNLDVIKSVDHVIDLGPKAAVGGGRIVAEGPPRRWPRWGRATPASSCLPDNLLGLRSAPEGLIHGRCTVRSFTMRGWLMRVAVIIPVLNEAESLPQLFGEIGAVAESSGYQLDVFVVDDGSTDSSAEVALQHGATVLRSGRNRGKAAALQAGFDASTGYDFIVTMDGDLQDDPAEIPRLLAGLTDADLVSGWKRDRQDGWGRRLQSRVFTAAVRGLTGIDLHDFNCGFKAYRRAVVDDLALYGDLHRLVPVLVHDAGGVVVERVVNHRPRVHGRSRYGVGRILRGPFDLLTVVFLSRLGRRPMHFFGLVGVLLGASGFGIGVYLSWLRLVRGQAIGDRPLLALAVLLMVLGFQLFATGLIAELIVSSRWGNLRSNYRRLGDVPPVSWSQLA
jgi:glycosyltransferase involved in cell wall biosynthesis/energy-coupling factor transporter ATP-binding protein EcfA2